MQKLANIEQFETLTDKRLTALEGKMTEVVNTINGVATTIGAMQEAMQNGFNGIQQEIAKLSGNVQQMDTGKQPR